MMTENRYLTFAKKKSIKISKTPTFSCLFYYNLRRIIKSEALYTFY